MNASALMLPDSSLVRSLADDIVSVLSLGGIDTYFGVPGGAIEPLFNALARAERNGVASFYGMRHEAAAGFAADGYFREAGRMAVCTATTGPGTANLFPAVMAADADRIPMLVLTPQVPLCKQGRGALQDSSSDGYDLTRVFGEITRYSSGVTHPDQLSQKLSTAVARAFGARRGPVHLSVPSELLAAAASAPLASLPKRPRSNLVDLHALNGMVDFLHGLARIVLYVGDDAGPSAHRLCELAERFDWDVVSSPGGKRWVSHTAPRYRGVVGFSGHQSAHRLVQHAECVVAFGATFDELSTNAWTVLDGVPLYSVDTHTEHAFRLPGIRTVVADTETTIDHLRSQIPACVVERREHLGAELTDVTSRCTGRPVPPRELIGWLNQNLGSHVVLHADAGNSFSWTARYLRRTEPDTYRVAMGASAMGWASSAAIGCAVASGRRTTCLCGDGAMLMSSLELTTALQHQLPVTFLVLNDSSLGMVRHGQRLGGAESMGHQLPEVRFDLVAQACGVVGLRVDSLSELETLDKHWLTSDEGGPAVIDVRIDADAVPPMIERVLGLRASA